jgi:hypothetical protein
MARPAQPKFMNNSVFRKLGACKVGALHEGRLLANCHSCLREECTDTELSERKEVPEAVQWQFDEFSRPLRKQGASVLLKANEFLGHVKLLAKAALYIAKELNSRPETIEKNFRFLAGHGSTTEMDFARDWYQNRLMTPSPTSGRILSISGPVCWLFRGTATKGPDELLVESTVDQLPCRLGLPEFLAHKKNTMCPSMEFVGYIVLGKNVTKPVRPSVFDGDYVSVRDVWSSSGKTLPISWAPQPMRKLGGLREVVSDAPKFTEISDRFHVFDSASFTK